MAIRTIALNVFLDVLRKKIFYVLVLFAAVLILTLPSLPSFGVGVRIDLFRDFALGLMSLFAIVITIAIGVNQVPSEVERRTVYNILSKPVPRTAFVAGKLAGLVLTMAVVILAMACFTFLAVAVFFGRVDPSLFVASWTMFLEVAVIAAFVVMGSTSASPPITATLTVVFYFFGHVKSTLLEPVLAQGGAGVLPVRILYYVVPSLETFNVNDRIAHNVAVPAARIGAATLYAALFVLAFLVIGAAVFQRKDV